ncbi:hypothetical protein [Paenibacillus sp. PAMC21692]|uniref:hypothetical protein n=1 Tax=Paenibacillus sp. PAMC21692 TaxID=2762320 RepID=UPI00164E23A4|nr:hypothetical protein [Paenibacillus sp. PAMC21692]QNK57505.1 hypothetical protein H7F31_00505 [Paenibacillus sp. PAMC21692]
MDKLDRHTGSGTALHKWMLAGLIGAALLLGAGCSGAEPGKEKGYGHDGYMGYSNSNPSLMNRNTTLLYEKDTRMIEQVLKPVAGIRSTRVSFNGSELHVRLTADPEMTDAQLEKLRARAQAIVQTNMPRYEVHVKASR